MDAGISKSEASGICGGLDEIVGAFRTRTLGHIEFPYVYLDATYLHVRNTTGQVVSMAVVVATGIAADGSREILGTDVGDSEDETFWRGFLTSLKGRGLSGVRLVISDQHAGLVKALRRCFQGAGHQRCRVHFARNLLAHVPKSHMDMVAAMFRTIFAQPDADAWNIRSWVRAPPAHGLRRSEALLRMAKRAETSTLSGKAYPFASRGDTSAPAPMPAAESSCALRAWVAASSCSAARLACASASHWRRSAIGYS